MKQNNEKQIEEIVFETLCRVCKENKIYSYLICSVSLDNYILSSIRTYRNIMLYSQENPFAKCNSRSEIIELLKTMKRKYPNEFGDVKKKQMVVMDYVNALIHYCLEIYICKKHIVKIEDIGRETFEMSCKKIFGDDFKDETGVNNQQLQRDLSSLNIERVKSAYDYLSSKGVIGDSTSLMDFVNQVLSTPRNQFECDAEIEDVYDDDDEDTECFLPF